MKKTLLRDKIRNSLQGFPWRKGLLRMAMDAVLLNFSIWLALVTWMFLYAYVLHFQDMEKIGEAFHDFLHGYWLVWTVISLAVYTANGFYSRARGYIGRHKAWVIFRSITLGVVTFIIVDYFVYRSTLLPRSVAFIGWFYTLLMVGGIRLAKVVVLRMYRVEPRANPPAPKLKRVLVVGGAGYLGSWVVPMLLERGYKVRVLDSYLFGQQSLEPVSAHPEYEERKGDIRDIEAVVEAMRDCQAVIHLAGLVGDPACEEDRPLTAEINRAATQMLINVARGYRIRRFLFASSCSVYGASDMLVDEETAPNPISMYALTKLNSENLLMEAANGSFNPTSLRLGTLFGMSRRPRFDLVVNLLTARAATIGKITVYNGEQWRPFLHVADAARAFVTLLEAPVQLVSGQIYNVGDSSMNMRLGDVSDLIAGMVPELAVEHIENADKRNYRVSFDKICRTFDFACERSVEEGIREIYDSIRTGQIRDFTDSRYNNQVVTRAFVQSASAARSSMRSLSTLAKVD